MLSREEVRGRRKEGGRKEEGGRRPGQHAVRVENAEEGLRNKKGPERCFAAEDAKSEEQAPRKVEGEGGEGGAEWRRTQGRKEERKPLD